MEQIENKIERVKVMRDQASRTRKECLKDESISLRVEKIALANVLIENCDNILDAYDRKDSKLLETLYHEYSCILAVAAEEFYQKR
jgi:hypothetical protein